MIEPKTGRKLAKLECLDSRGFFSGVIPRRKNFFRYQLAVVWHGQQNLIDDPYRFGPLIQEMDAWLLSEGTHLRPYETLGAHADTMDGVTGTRFSVWAPNARRVSVVGQFNYWDGRRHPMRLRKESGIWELFIPGAHNGQLYKYEMIDANGNLRLKSDPYAFEAQMRPETASLICGLPEKVVQTEERKKANQFDAPISIYEVHLGSWRRHTDNNFWLSYRELYSINWCLMLNGWALPISSYCPLTSIPSMAVGVISQPACMHRPAVLVLATTSVISLMPHTQLV